MKYDEKLQNSHRDLLFLAQHIKVQNCIKLMTTLYDKKNYVLHFRSLKQALKAGLKLEKVHRVLKFKQSRWLKEYIDFNRALRTRATSIFEKNLYKLANNAIFGKTLENTRRRRNIKLCTQ